MRAGGDHELGTIGMYMQRVRRGAQRVRHGAHSVTGRAGTDLVVGNYDVVTADTSVAAGVIHGDINHDHLASDRHLADELRTEIRDLADSARKAVDDYLKSARWWGRVHLTLGLPAAIIATVSGATGLASTTSRVPAGILALCAAAMSAAASFLGSEAKVITAEQRAAALATVATDARLLATFDLGDGQSKELRKRLTSLIDRFEAIRANDLAAAHALKIRERDS